MGVTSTRLQVRHEDSAEHSNVSLFDKAGIFLSLILTTVISSLLLALDLTNWTWSGTTYHLVTSHRASIQVVTQLVAHMLGLIQVTSVCQLITLSARLYFARSRMSLDKLQWYSNLSRTQLGWDSPTRYLLPSIIMVAWSFAPAAIWVGAITPVSTSP